VLAVVTTIGGQLASVSIVGADEGSSTETTTSGETKSDGPKCTPSEKSDNSFSNPSHCATKEPNPILPELREIVWGLGSFLVLLLLLRLWLYPKVKGNMDRRAAKIDGDLAAAEAARASVVSERQSYADRIASARAEGSQFVEAVRSEVEAVRAERIGALNTELAAQRAAAAAENEASVAAARASFADAVANLSVQAASKVLAKPLTKDANVAVINEYLASQSEVAQ
jgi:F-type H+-transporting ATPase subunit b